MKFTKQTPFNEQDYTLLKRVVDKLSAAVSTAVKGIKIGGTGSETTVEPEDGYITINTQVSKGTQFRNNVLTVYPAGTYELGSELYRKAAIGTYNMPVCVDAFDLAVRLSLADGMAPAWNEATQRAVLARLGLVVDEDSGLVSYQAPPED